MAGVADAGSAALERVATSCLMRESSVVVVVLDSEMIVRWASPSADTLGLSPVGLSIVELVHADDLDRVATTFEISANADDGRSSLFTNVVIPLRVSTPARVVPFEATGRWVRTIDRATGAREWFFVVALIDVTTRFAVTEALQVLASDVDERTAIQVLVDACRSFNGIDGSQVVWWSAEGERCTLGDLGPSPQVAEHLSVVEGDLDAFGELGHPFELIDYDWAHVFPVTSGSEMLGAFGFWGWGPAPEVRFLSVVVAPLLDLAALALARAQAQAALATRANTDPLTGLLNRRAFMDEFPVRHNEHVALMYIDLDAFKKVNDRWGHSVGDRVLQQVAQRLRNVLSRGDAIARIGGDEFAVLCRWVEPEAATGIAHRVVEALNSSHDVDGVEVPGGASVGLTVGTRRTPGPDLLDRADRALMLAKAQGKARLVVTLEDGSGGSG
ncbi:MAG: GGDEF domain-containing protein [Actinomycetota bacterium]